MKVRIAYTNNKVTFTQRGKGPKRGFVRVNGFTVSGYIGTVGSETVFYTDGINNDIPYQRADSASW